MNCWREKKGLVAEATSLRFRQVRILSFKTLKTLKPKVPYRSDAFQNDHKSNGYHLKYQQQLLLCKIPPILQLMNFCQTSSVFSDPLDLLDHPLLLDIFFRGAPQLRAGVGFYFFTKCPLRNTLVVTFKLCYCALEIDLNKIRLVFTCKWSQL